MTEVTLPRGSHPASLVLDVIEELAQHGELYMRIGSREASLPLTEAEIADVLRTEPWWQVSVSATLSDPESLVYVTNTSVRWQVDDANASLAAAKVRRILGDPDTHAIFPGSVGAPPLEGGVDHLSSGPPRRDVGLALLDPITREEHAGVEEILSILWNWATDTSLTDAQHNQFLAVAEMIKQTRVEATPGETPRTELVMVVKRGLKYLTWSGLPQQVVREVAVTAARVGWQFMDQM